VALVEGSLVVNSSQGGGSKDTWVLASERRTPPAPAATVPERDTYQPLPALDTKLDIEIQQQQEQQQQAGGPC
jgi:hypothetical protein